MRTKVLYYAAFYDAPDYKEVAYIKAQYSDGSIRYWYPKDKGFKDAKYRVTKNQSG